MSEPDMMYTAVIGSTALWRAWICDNHPDIEQINHGKNEVTKKDGSVYRFFNKQFPNSLRGCRFKDAILLELVPREIEDEIYLAKLR